MKIPKAFVLFLVALTLTLVIVPLVVWFMGYQNGYYFFFNQPTNVPKAAY